MSKTSQPISCWRETVAELLADVPRLGARVGVGGFHFTRIPVGQLLELRREHREITYVAWGGGLALELLLAAGAVARAELTFSSLDVFGLAPRFRCAIEQGEIALEEWTALGQITGLQAQSHRVAMGVMSPLLGTDLGAPWARALENPATPLAAAPAVQLDAFLLHAARADASGNVELRGARGIDLSAIYAADRVLVTVDERVPDGTLGREHGAVVIPRAFVSGIVELPHGAYPTSSLPAHPADYRRLREIAAVPADAPLPDALLTVNAPRAAALQAAAGVAPAALRAALSAAPATVAAGDGDATRDEILVCALARTVGDGDIATVGSASPLPTIAYMLAKLLWAPDVTIMSYNGGLVDIPFRPVALALAEQLDFAGAALHAGGDETYHWYYQQGRVTHEVVGAAQIDRTGATNNISIRRADGSTIRLPGQGGMADVANLHANFLLYLPRQSQRNMVDKVDVRSASRAIPGDTVVLTDLGRFALDRDAGELTLTHRHPGVTLDEVQANTGWPLRVAADLRETPAPTREELTALRERVDPLGVRRLDFVAAADRGPLIDELLAREEAVLDDAMRASAAAATAIGAAA